MVAPNASEGAYVSSRMTSSLTQAGRGRPGISFETVTCIFGELDCVRDRLPFEGLPNAYIEQRHTAQAGAAV